MIPEDEKFTTNREDRERARQSRRFYLWMALACFATGALLGMLWMWLETK